MTHIELCWAPETFSRCKGGEKSEPCWHWRSWCCWTVGIFFRLYLHVVTPAPQGSSPLEGVHHYTSAKKTKLQRHLKTTGLCESVVRDGNFGCGPTVTTEVCKDFSMTSLCWVLPIYMSLSTFTTLLVTYWLLCTEVTSVTYTLTFTL